MPLQLETAIIKTIAYADVFDYPLREDEAWKRLIECKSEKLKFSKALKKLAVVKQMDGYYFLSGRERLVAVRKEREVWSRVKWRIAQKAATLLSYIPTVKLVGISGALANDNATRDDDVDFFIVTRTGFLWTTRLFSILLMELMGMRRRPEGSPRNNAICMNMFVDEAHLALPVKDRDLYSAHEVILMKPLVVKDDMYTRFISANEWIHQYLPNAWLADPRHSGLSGIRRSYSLMYRFRTSRNDSVNQKIFLPIQFILQRLQQLYMKKRRTIEIIQPGVLRFHPQDARTWVMKQYHQRLKQLKIEALG